VSKSLLILLSAAHAPLIYFSILISNASGRDCTKLGFWPKPENSSQKGLNYLRY